MNFLTFFLISLSIPKYYLFIILNALFFFFKNIKNFHLLLFSNKKEIFLGIIIFLIMCSFFYSYDFSIIKIISWASLYAMFYLTFILNENIFSKKKYLFFLKILFFATLFYIIYTFIVSFIIEYPILRNGLLHPNKIMILLFKDFFYDIDYNYEQLILERVNIAFLYLKIYTCTIALISILIIEKSKNLIFLILLPILLIIGTSFGSRSFIIFFLISNIFLIIFNKNTMSFLIIFINLLILIFNINFFMNEKTSESYLKFFKFDNERINAVINQTNDNELNYKFFDTNSLSNTKERFPKNLNEMKIASKSRLQDNIIGFKAILYLKSKNDLVEYFKKENPDSYFIKQKFFHNTYLNFFYLGSFWAFLLFTIININFFLNLILYFKENKNNPTLYSLFFLFIGFQYIFFIETPLLTDKNIFFIYLVFFCFSKKKQYLN